MDIKRTEKKLREAQCFLGYLRSHASTPFDKREPFDFYLSAFLNATYSVQEVLQVETKIKELVYKQWYKDWKAKLEANDQKLFPFMIGEKKGSGQRHKEVHATGAEYDKKGTEISLFDYDTLCGDRCGRFEIFGSPYSLTGTAPPTFTRHEQLFQLDGEPKEVVSVCEKWLDLLMRLVHDFCTGEPWKRRKPTP